MSDETPTLHLLEGNELTAEKLIALYEKLTGRKMSDEGKAKYRQAFDAEERR